MTRGPGLGRRVGSCGHLICLGGPTNLPAVFGSGDVPEAATSRRVLPTPPKTLSVTMREAICIHIGQGDSAHGRRWSRCQAVCRLEMLAGSSSASSTGFSPMGRCQATWPLPYVSAKPRPKATRPSVAETMPSTRVLAVGLLSMLLGFTTVMVVVTILVVVASLKADRAIVLRRLSVDEASKHKAEEACRALKRSIWTVSASSYRFFSETGAGKHVPRCVMVDLAPWTRHVMAPLRLRSPRWWTRYAPAPIASSFTQSS